MVMVVVVMIVVLVVVVVMPRRVCGSKLRGCKLVVGECGGGGATGPVASTPPTALNMT